MPNALYIYKSHVNLVLANYKRRKQQAIANVCVEHAWSIQDTLQTTQYTHIHGITTTNIKRIALWQGDDISRYE